MSIAKLMKLPAPSLLDPAVSVGVNGGGLAHGPPPGPAAISMLLVSNASPTAGVTHGVTSELAVYTPHAGGVTSAPCAPPFKETRRSLNGSSGAWGSESVTWPVTGFRASSPSIFRYTPFA